MGELDTYFTNLIAEIDGISPEEVTVEYIEQQREKHIYPDTRFNFYSDYSLWGGISAPYTK